MKKNKKRNNIVVTILSIIMFFLGICIFLYPTVSNYLANVQYNTLIKTYEENNNKISEVVKTDELEKAIQYNKSLIGDEVYDPFLPGSGYAIPDNYNEILNTSGDGVMGFIEIPKIKVKIPVFHGSSPEILQKGIGHLETSALPIGGLGNNPILTGHRGLPSAELFTRLDELKIGDLFYLNVLNDILAYKVSNIMEILPGDTSKLGAYKDRDIVTLITCTPYGVNTHRLVIQGDRTLYIPEEKAKIKEVHSFKLSQTTIVNIIGIIMGCISLYVIIKILKKRKMENNVINNKEKNNQPKVKRRRKK